MNNHVIHHNIVIVVFERLFQRLHQVLKKGLYAHIKSRNVCFLFFLCNKVLRIKLVRRIRGMNFLNNIRIV